MTGNFFWLNENLLESKHWADYQNREGTVVYEVIRIINGVPLFYSEHYQRLINSIRLINQSYEPDKKKLFCQLSTLAKINDLDAGNISLKLIFHDPSGQPDEKTDQPLRNPLLLINFIAHSYPDGKQYSEGVKTGFLDAERNNPEAKVIQEVRDKANTILSQTGLFELLLVDQKGFITEGSKSNMVFIKNDILYTCPLNRVLTGITLSKVIEIARRDHIPIVFEAISRSEIASCDSLFITGTSPKILPVAQAEEVHFNVNNDLLHHLMKEYDLLIEQDIKRRKINY